MLEAQARPALLGGRLFAPTALAAGGIGHGMGFVKHDNPVKIAAEPFDNLRQARGLAFAFLRAECRISREEDAFGKADRATLPETRQRSDLQALMPKGGPVALRVFQQPVRHRNP